MEFADETCGELSPNQRNICSWERNHETPHAWDSEGLRKELERYQAISQAAMGSPRMFSAAIENEALEIRMEPNLVIAIIFDGLKRFLDEHQAVNYVEQHLIPAGSNDEWHMIVGRPGGKTPHQLRIAAEAERDIARHKIVDWWEDGAISEGMAMRALDMDRLAAREYRNTLLEKSDISR